MVPTIHGTAGDGVPSAFMSNGARRVLVLLDTRQVGAPYASVRHDIRACR